MVSSSFTVSCNSSPRISFRLIYVVRWALLILPLNRVSAFRHSCCIVFLPLQVVILENELGFSISFLHISLMCPRAMATALCIRNFRDFTFHDFRHYAPLTPSQQNFDHLPHVLWFHGPKLILIQRLQLNRDFAILTFLMHWVLCLSMLGFTKLRYGVWSMIQIWSLFNNCD